MFGYLQTHQRYISSPIRRFTTALVLAIGLILSTSTARAQGDDNPFSVSVGHGDAETISIDFTVPDGHYLYAAQLKVVESSAALTPKTTPEPKPKADPFSGDTVDVYDHDFQLVYTTVPNAEFPLKITVEYQGCSETLCYMPQTETFDISAPGVVTLATDEVPPLRIDNALLAGFNITGRDSGFKKPAEFIAFLDRVDVGEGVSENIIQTVMRKHGIAVMVLFVLLGGFLLNLTPCVLPMIPVNIAIIGAGSQAGSRTRGFALGATYGLGISLVYGILGVVVVLTGSQFGTLNASPWFNLAIAMLFAALSLAMFGVFNIDFSRFQSRGQGKGGHGPFITAFTFGGIAALLAGACVAPILIGVLLFSTEVYQRGATAGLLLPFALGLGMALPWPFAGAGLSFMPKPGQWMERIKIGFGIVILGAALYYGVLGVRLLAPTLQDEVPETVTGEFTWLTSLDNALAVSRSTGKPVFVDVWATWCKSCKAMSRTTFRDADVLARLGAYVPLKFQAENPKDPETKRVLDALGVKGQPFYVVLQPEKVNRSML